MSTETTTVRTINIMGDTPLEQLASTLAMFAPVVEGCEQKAWRNEVRFTIARELMRLSRELREMSKSCDIIDRETCEVVGVAD